MVHMSSLLAGASTGHRQQHRRSWCAAVALCVQHFAGRPSVLKVLGLLRVLSWLYVSVRLVLCTADCRQQVSTMLHDMAFKG